MWQPGWRWGMWKFVFQPNLSEQWILSFQRGGPNVGFLKKYFWPEIQSLKTKTKQNKTTHGFIYLSEKGMLLLTGKGDNQSGAALLWCWCVGGRSFADCLTVCIWGGWTLEVKLTFKIRVKSSCKAPDESKGIVSILTVCMDRVEMIPLSRWKCRTQALFL